MEIVAARGTVGDWGMRNPQEQAGAEAESGTCARLSGPANCTCVSRIRHTCGQERNYRSRKGTLFPLPHHTPSTQAPFLPNTTSTKRSSSSSYSIRAWRRETLFRGPRSTYTCVCSEEEAVEVGMERRPMVTLRVWR